MKYFLICFILFQVIFANENLTLSEESLFEKQAQIQAIIDEQIPKNNENEEDEEKNYSNKLLYDDDANFKSSEIDVDVEVPTTHLFEQAEVNKYFLNQKKSKNLYVNYEKIPKVVFKKQRFEVVLKLIITTDEFEKIETRFLNSENITVLNPTRQWEYGFKNQFFNRYYFKTESSKFIMPGFQVLIYKEGKVFETVTLNPKKIKYTDIATQDEGFSNVIAEKLKIKLHKTKQYTNNQLLTILELDAVEGNLEDFNLNFFKEQGISSISGEYPNQSAIYYAIVPLHVKKIEFDYYNILTNNFEKLSSPIVLKNELISTQTDLNPNKNNLLLYKKITFGVLTLFFFIIYFFKKRFFNLILGFIFFIIFILYNMPNKKVFIKEGSNIFILPTNNSTIFKKIDKVKKAEILSEKNGFYKIILLNNNKEIIGWIKERNIVKD